MRIQPKLADEPGQRGRHLVAPNGGTQLSQMVAATNAVDVQTPYPVVHSFAAAGCWRSSLRRRTVMYGCFLCLPFSRGATR